MTNADKVSGRKGFGGPGRQPVVAIAHDYLTQRGGAERVVLAMHRAFPEATIYTTLYSPDRTYPEFKNAKIVTSVLNRIPAFQHNHRLALPFLAIASSALKVPGDIVVASSTGWAHGFNMEGRVLVYCNTPARWLYLTEQYLGGSPWRTPVGWGLLAVKPLLILWDRRAVRRADRYVGNSTAVRERIKEVYGIDAEVFHPPHSVDTSGDLEPIPGIEEFIGRGGHFLVVSRLLPYKNVDQAIEAFRGLKERLLVIGSGPLAARLQEAMPANVRLAADLTDAQLRWAYASSQAVIAPSYEDFGITPLEGGAWGKPTIALRAGGYLDTIVDGLTGTFIDKPSPALIRAAVRAFRPEDWDADAIRAHVDKFSEERFRTRLHHEVAALAGQ